MLVKRASIYSIRYSSLLVFVHLVQKLNESGLDDLLRMETLVRPPHLLLHRSNFLLQLIVHLVEIDVYMLYVLDLQYKS